jgi:hypothetical protein
MFSSVNDMLHSLRLAARYGFDAKNSRFQQLLLSAPQRVLQLPYNTQYPLNLYISYA